MKEMLDPISLVGQMSKKKKGRMTMRSQIRSSSCRATHTETLPSFNLGRPLSIVVSQDGTRVGVKDESRGHGMVWWEGDMASSAAGDDIRSCTALLIPSIPPEYGGWNVTVIGGVSLTVRRLGIVRCNDDTSDVVVFSVKGQTRTSAEEALSDVLHLVRIGEKKEDGDLGHITEVIVHKSGDVAQISSLLARKGCVPILENKGLNLRRSLGVERLDRVPAKVVTDETMVQNSQDLFGPRRGGENWRFPWIPASWKHVPITWDHMVENVIDEDIRLIPQPLRQHVARVRLDRGMHPPVGSRWEPLRGGTKAPSDNVLSWNALHGEEEEVPFHIQYRIVSLSQEDQDKVKAGKRDVSVVVNCKTFTCIDGTWYRPVNTKQFLEDHIPKGLKKKKYVSAHLTKRQSMQIIEAFYLLAVEKVSDPLLIRGCCLVLFTYMKERGYTARWIGRYDQDANHICNGDSAREFKNLDQYKPENLPTHVINKVCGPNGTLLHRGSKGSRSKYKQEGQTHYIPKRRLARTENDEKKMRMA